MTDTPQDGLHHGMNDGLHVHIERLGSAHHALVSGLQLDVPAGEILTLMGPSGCGKSSVLAAIAGTLASVSEGLQPLQLAGRVQLHGRELTGVPTHLRGVGLVFQDALLFPHMTVAENLLFAVPGHLPQAERRQRVVQALQEADLAGLGERDPSTLSGGQRARVALMRALLAEPQALLLDEPFSKLDADLRAQLRPWVFAHVRQRRIPVVLVTHDRQDIADPQRVVHLTAPEPKTMLDRQAQRLLRPALVAISRLLVRSGVGADTLTWLGFSVGLAAALAITMQAWWLGLGLLLASRLLDGLDGTVARLTQPTDAGAFLDIALDFVFYAAIPLAFAVADPAANALAAAVLLASFIGTGSSFLAFAALAEKRGLTDNALPGKSFYFLGGLTEATETIAVFAAMCVWPEHFTVLAYGFAALCAVTMGMRVWWGYGRLR